MKKWVNGAYLDMTEEEVKALENPPEKMTEPEPSAEQRLCALEMAMLELIMKGGEEGG